MEIWQYGFSTHLLQKRQGNGDMLALYFIRSYIDIKEPFTTIAPKNQ